MPQTISSFDASLKEYYEGPVRRVINHNSRVMRYTKKDTKPWEGRLVRFPVHVQRSEAVAFLQGGEALPATQNQVTIECQINRKQCWGHIGLTDDLIEAAKTDRGSFERPMALEIEGMARDFVSVQNRAAFGTGEGKLGEVKSYNAGTTTVTCTAMTDPQGSGINGNAGNRFVRVGMLLDIYTSGGVARKLGVKVTSMNVANNTFVLTGGTGADPQATDGFYRARPSQLSPINNEPMGMGGVLDDGTYVGVLHNINRTTYPIWQAQILNAGTFAAPGALTLDLLQRAFDMASEGGNGEPRILWAHYSVRREYLKLLVTDRRYIEPYKYEPGFKESQTEEDLKTTLEFNGVPFVFDKDCPWATIFGHAPGTFTNWENAPGHWVQDGKGGVFQLVPGTAGLFQAQFSSYYNFGTNLAGPNSGFAIRNISATVDRVNPA